MRQARRRGLGSRAGERGQMLIMFAMIVAPVTFAVGAVAVDASMWQSERRGAQKDADLAALAGAYELLVGTNDPVPARAAAEQYQELNDEAGNASVIGTIAVDNSCFNSDVLDSVIVNVDHDSRTFFATAFGIDIAPEIGAHARACMGSPIEGEGIFPLGVQVSSEDTIDTSCFEPDPDDPTGPELPVFGQYCQLAFAGADLTSGEGGWLRLFDNGGDACSDTNVGGGGNLLQEEIAQGGANTTCYVAPPGTTPADCDGPPPPEWPTPYVNYCVWPKTQTFSNPTQNAFTDLMATEGECDTLFGSDANTYDDWLEVVEAVNGDPNPDPGTTTFARRACKSPRLVNLIILESFEANGNDPKPILAFASFYIDACVVDGVEFRDCDVSGGNIGQAALKGFFMNILNLGSLGAVNKYGQRTIALTE